MKTIKEALRKIDVEQKTIEKIGAFLKTKRGQSFVSKLYTSNISDLRRRFNAPKYMCLYTNDQKNRNLILAAIKEYSVTIPIYTPVDRCIEKPVKYQIYLKKKELNEILARRPKKLGFAAQMHEYEEYKISRFIKRNPFLTDKELAEDLFAAELKTTRDTQLWLYREYVRNFLCKRFLKTEKREQYYRLFMVYENKVTGKPYEKEGDPYIVGYPFAGCNEYTDLEHIKDLLRNRVKTIRDTECLELKVYNKYGKLLASARTKNQRSK